MNDAKGGEPMSGRSPKFLAIFFALSFLISGCYYFAAKKEMKNAAQSVSELKAAGGEKLVPYEYTSAEKFLEISRIEFDENDFKAAKGFATRSKSASEAGLSHVKKK